ncbi:response regulator transcription factor [Streptomyces tubbatahanensis]|uniref:Response regulator transcription factor n=1 Tax=Streptomyces tubbatahanensis TaxID=2923272 RepID=A0ABY3XP02_9ACTN|nr:response regulator transcription factor [Streptomyces tubbatahanensis]UNS96192.1 response regulator transcription factor [Streptomyces tubbatahanensis]
MPGSDSRGARSARPAAPVRVFLLDDHEVVRRGLRDLLEAEDDLSVVGEACDAAQALARVPALRPDVAVLDVRLGSGAGPGENGGAGPGANSGERTGEGGGDHGGIEVCRELRALSPDLVCLMLTSFDDDEALFDAVMAGAAGYVLKQIRGADLVSAIRTVASGGSLIDPGTRARVTARAAAPGTGREGRAVPAELARLTPREREVLTLVGEGLTNRQIGERLFLAEKTVKNRISAILGKLGVGRRVQAAVLAERLSQESPAPGGGPLPGDLTP